MLSAWSITLSLYNKNYNNKKNKNNKNNKNNTNKNDNKNMKQATLFAPDVNSSSSNHFLILVQNEKNLDSHTEKSLDLCQLLFHRNVGFRFLLILILGK